MEKESDYQQAVWSFHHRLGNIATAALEYASRLDRVSDLPPSAREAVTKLHEVLDEMVLQIQDFQRRHEKTQPVKTAGRGRVLVVDDEPILLKLEAETLSRDYGVDTAQTMDQAVRLLVERSYDVVFLDLFLGGDHGGRSIYQMLLEARPEMADRVVFVTGGVVDPDLQDFLHRTGRPVLNKPFSTSLLRETAQRVGG